jgi:hypothetical protein
MLTHRALQHPSTHWQLAVLQDAGSMLAALLGTPVLLGIADNILLGKGAPLHLQRAPTPEILQHYFGWLMYSNAIQLMANKPSTVKKKHSTFERLNEFISVTGRHALQATPQDLKAYLGMWSATTGRYQHSGLHLCAPMSAKCVVSFLATEYDRHPTTTGPWNPLTATGSPPHRSPSLETDHLAPLDVVPPQPVSYALAL